MAEQMTSQDVAFQERRNTGTAWTRNADFEKDGYLVVKDLCDPEELYYPLPQEKGQLNYYDSDPTHFNHTPVEGQVEGCLSRYWHPQYRKTHSVVRKKLEKILDRKLYNTYYYDRYYFPGQALSLHADRDACEISVTVHVSTNLPDDLKDWPVKIKTPDTYTDKTKQNVLVPGEPRACILDPGDGMIYKGCERPHWRAPMPSPQSRKRDWVLKKIGRYKETEYYYHQIFFHYVLADGERAQCAGDKAR